MSSSIKNPAPNPALIAPPVYIRANFNVVISGQKYDFLNQHVSQFGISGLRWGVFDPTDRVGEKVPVTVDILAKNRFKFVTMALITSEMTTDATYLGFRFLLTDQERAKLAQVIAQEGFCPTQYIRKYPRIPATEKIPNMPLRAIARANTSDLIVFDIANLSPNGILLYSENPKTAMFVPGSRIYAQIEPRGSIFNSFEFEGLVCRVSLEKNPQTGNTVRYMGIKFLNIPAEDRENLLEILRAVLNNIQRA